MLSPHQQSGERLTEARHEAEATNRPRRKLNCDGRIAQLLAERKRDRARIAELQTQVANNHNELESLRGRLSSMAPLQAEREKQLKELPDRIVAAHERGRKLFNNFDVVVAAVQIDRQAFEAILGSTNGPELMYAAGLGMDALARFHQLRAQAASDEEREERVSYYRKLHQQHFHKEQINGH